MHASQLAQRVFFFFNDTATTEIYTLSLHDALPISRRASRTPECRGIPPAGSPRPSPPRPRVWGAAWRDRKSTRLKSSHGYNSYAVFCLKKKNQRHVLADAAAHGTEPTLAAGLLQLV